MTAGTIALLLLVGGYISINTFFIIKIRRMFKEFKSTNSEEE